MPPRFTPAWWLPHAHLQTIYGSLFARQPAIAFRRERWTTPDADFVDVDFVDGPGDAPWVHLFHGLEGSSNSPYARRLMENVRLRGWRGSVFHFRGCSGEPNSLPRAYHSGDSEEIDWSLRRIRERCPGVALHAVGISRRGSALGDRRCGDSLRAPRPHGGRRRAGRGLLASLCAAFSPNAQENLSRE